MSYISYDTFAKLANPAIIEHINEYGGFDEHLDIINSVVYHITKIDIPDNESTTPKWLVMNIVYLLQKSIMNKMQNISDDLRNQINADYDTAITSLNSFKSSSVGGFSVLMPLKGVVGFDDYNSIYE